jgi:hypothetical protein
MGSPAFNRPLPNARFASGPTGQIPVKFTGAPDGPMSGMIKMRGIRDMTSHQELCSAFGLNDVDYYFDLPSSMRNIGSNRTGRGEDGHRRLLNGFVFQHGRDRPIGKVWIIDEGERLRDDDPTSRADFENLGHA